MQYTFKVQAKLSLPSILELSSLDDDELEDIHNLFQPDEEYSVTLQYSVTDGVVTLLGVDDLVVIADQLVSLENGMIIYESEL